jgi:hypothetical protein
LEALRAKATGTGVAEIERMIAGLKSRRWEARDAGSSNESKVTAWECKLGNCSGNQFS